MESYQPCQLEYGTGGPIPRYIWLADLQLEQNQLTAVIAHGKERTAVTFDISKLLAARP